ncbi:hypothetical protein SAMN06297129_1847 [Pseudooceanicola antarcticus]|uniref:Uncharacterized protein n=1 Tax=Pseudooceanicola antarcticus TaxID=1247613 RepID=A0A285IR08_9RHOB|nr:DUF6173 family protein [Pseudooceanicola antarcticus]PJE31819.1 hypothetical protein CVM39_01565 [Pseudooceanicola antarcticus]SNY50465.1 hypothetical protein SAMN06297129_1847 [Pseudooceanicola antarcticus]
MQEEMISTSAEAVEDSILPCRHEARADGVEPAAPLPENVIDKPVASKSPAAWAYERLILYIQQFEETLDSDHEVAMGFAGGDAGVLRIEGMGYFDPDIVTFSGTDAHGVRTQLVQHVSQLSVILRAMPKVTQHAEPARIGFRLRADLEKTGK